MRSSSPRTSVAELQARLRQYWSLIKSLQTGLLLLTGIASYLSAHIPFQLLQLAQLIPSLFLAVSGATVMNMWWDRDIDARMKRTHMRPAPAGTITSGAILALGALASALGIGWSMLVDRPYGTVVLAGWLFDVVVYSAWLKRRTCWSIVWGGVAGAMPALAGRALAVGRVDAIGLLLAAAILFWIPTHTLTFSLKFEADYRAAGVPTFPSTYGPRLTRVTIAISSALASAAMSAAAIWIGAAEGVVALIMLLSAILLFLATTVVVQPSDRTNLRLYKYASLYMMLSMMLLVPRLG